MNTAYRLSIVTTVVDKIFDAETIPMDRLKQK